MYKQKIRPMGEASVEDYTAGLNEFWATTGRITDQQIEAVLLTTMYGGSLNLPTFADIVPQIEQNLQAAREHVGWLEAMGLAVVVAVEGQPLLVRNFGFDNNDMYYEAHATPITDPAIGVLVPLHEPYPLGLVRSDYLPPDQQFIFTQLLG